MVVGRVHGPCYTEYIPLPRRPTRLFLGATGPSSLCVNDTHDTQDSIISRQKSIKMVDNYIRAYGITSVGLQDYLQRLFPTYSITVNVSDLYYAHFPLGSVQG